jgi:hypothetical protein
MIPPWHIHGARAPATATFNLRIPAELLVRVKAAANRAHRSANSHIWAILEDTLDPADVPPPAPAMAAPPTRATQPRPGPYD